jgi:phosphoserine phosphatase
MADRYGITDCIGSKYLLDDENRYTGGVEKMWDAESKKTAIDNFIEQYDIDASGSYAYGDTMSDLALFRRVGNPVAINPTRELLNHLAGDAELKDSVQVVVERKDVIYMLNPGVTICCPEFEP